MSARCRGLALFLGGLVAGLGLGFLSLVFLSFFLPLFTGFGAFPVLWKRARAAASSKYQRGGPTMPPERWGRSAGAGRHH